MNVLPFVMVMLMLLASLTYGRLQSFRSHKGIMHGFKVFIDENERASFNHAMEEKYDSIKVLSGSDDAEKNPTEKASAKLNLAVIFNPEKDPQRYEVYTQIAKQLIQKLMKEEPYFEQLQEDRPSCMDELFQALGQTEEKMTQLSQLYNIKLQDPVLNEFLYRILKEKTDRACVADCITVDTKNDNIRVYLAPKELLEALYKDEGTVEAIIQEREELYRLINRKEGMSVEEASTRFDALIKGYRTIALPQHLNTKVSKTDPKRY